MFMFLGQHSIAEAGSAAITNTYSNLITVPFLEAGCHGCCGSSDASHLESPNDHFEPPEQNCLCSKKLKPIYSPACNLAIMQPCM